MNHHLNSLMEPRRRDHKEDHIKVVPPNKSFVFTFTASLVPQVASKNGLSDLGSVEPNHFTSVDAAVCNTFLLLVVRLFTGGGGHR